MELGIELAAARQIAEARNEFLTVLKLDPGNKRHSFIWRILAANAFWRRGTNATDLWI